MKSADSRNYLTINKEKCRHSFEEQRRYRPVYPNPLVYRDAKMEMRPHKKKEEAEAKLMEYAKNVLNRQEYDD